MPEARIYHYGGQSTRQVRSEMVLALYRSKVRFMSKHYGPRRATVLRAIFSVALRLKWLLQTVQTSSRLLPNRMTNIDWHKR